MWTIMMALVIFMGFSANAKAQASVSVGKQITQESGIVDGGKYILQSQASGTPYITDSGTYYSVPNKANTATTACVYYFYKNDDGMWKIKNQNTGKYWGVPEYNSFLEPAGVYEAGAWSLNMSGGIAFPRAKAANGTTVLSIDRSSQKLVGWTTKSSNYSAQTMKIYEVVTDISTEALPELENKTVVVSSTPDKDVELGKWYTMFDRGTSPDAHGYLFEKVDEHKLYNTATAPSGTAVAAAKYLVRFLDAGNGQYYVQNGFGNYFGAFEHQSVVTVVAKASEPVIIGKIAGYDAHFYFQTGSTGVVMDANDIHAGDATVVGWGTTVPTSINGNNDWALYPVTLEDTEPSRCYH